MNLAAEPWIPVTDSTGSPARVSLREVFMERGARDLAVRPHERVALMRLLICIAQAALDGPEDREALENAASPLPAVAALYLDRWEGSFDLFHPEKPFLQFPGLAKPPKPPKKPKKSANGDEPEEEVSTGASKLDFALATGDDSTLFDHLAASTEARAFKPWQLALMLITFQCFSPSGRIGVACWKGVKTMGGGSSHSAPCTPSAMLHAFVRRENLFDTIHANLLTRHIIEKCYMRPWGQPVWERMPESLDATETGVVNATTTYLGRLMPLARAVLLHPEASYVRLANGLMYPAAPDKFMAEPTASTMPNRDGSGRILVSAGKKELWRELPSIVIKRLAGETHGPLVLNEVNDTKPLDLWVGAMLTDRARILDTVEGVYAIPAKMLNDPGRLAYEQEVQASERIANQLTAACKDYRQHLASMKTKFPRYPEERFAIRHYWTSVEHGCLPLLHAFLSAPDDGSDSTMALRKLWRAALRRAARDAFHAACANETPRQLRAHALALPLLFAGA